MNLLHYQKFTVIIMLLSLMNACAATPDIEQYQLSDSIQTHYRQYGMELLAVYQLHNPEQKPWLYEFSDLAWNHDEASLWSVTDTGYIVQFKPVFKDKKIISISIEHHAKLHNKDNLPLTAKLSDSEGIALINHQNGIPGDTECLVSFERIPRIIRYDEAGQYIKKYSLPPTLTDQSQYQTSNMQLESITIIKSPDEYLTAAERPLKSEPAGVIGLYSSKDKLTELQLVNAEHGSIVALTSLPNKDLIALERVYRNQFSALGFHLHRLSQEDNYQTIKQYQFDPNAALINDNFEGLTHVEDDYFFMITDDNQSALQRTLLIYFKLLE